MKKYNDFLTREGLLDSVNVDYERVKTDSYYGYVLQIKYDFKKYRRRKFVYDILYSLAVLLVVYGAIRFLVA